VDKGIQCNNEKEATRIYSGDSQSTTGSTGGNDSGSSGLPASLTEFSNTEAGMHNIRTRLHHFGDLWADGTRADVSADHSLVGGQCLDANARDVGWARENEGDEVSVSV
jgi:hypothetical protein